MVAYLAEMTQIVRDLLHDNDIELTAAARFDELNHWDSMHLVALVVEVESRFGLLFEAHEVESLHSIGDLLCVAARKRALASA